MFKLKKRLIKILSHHTGQDEKKVHDDSDRDYYMSAEEAKAYGLVDEVVNSEAGSEFRRDDEAKND